MTPKVGNTDPRYFNYMTYNLTVCWKLWAYAGEISLYIYPICRDRFLGFVDICCSCSRVPYMPFFKHGISVSSSIKITRQDLALLFPFSLSVLLVFSTFPITVSSFVFLVTAYVKLICIYHLTFNICWDVPQLEQLTFCCRQNQNYIVCVLCGLLVWLPFKNTVI